MKNKLNFSRQIQLLTMDLYIYKKSLLIYTAAVLFASLVLIYLLPSGALNSFRFSYRMYSVSMPLIIGLFIILTGFSFIEMDSPGKKTGYFLMPATMLEKYLTRLLSTMAGYLILIIVIYIIDSLFVKFLNSGKPWGGGNSFEFFKFNELSFKYLNFYIFFHAVYFYGAIAFNRNSFLKTSLVCFVFVFSVLALLKVLTLIFIPNVSVSFDLKLDLNVFYYSEEAYWKFETYRNTLGSIITFLAFYITPPFLWILGYFRLKEEEVANGIQ